MSLWLLAPRFVAEQMKRASEHISFVFLPEQFCFQVILTRSDNVDTGVALFDYAKIIADGIQNSYFLDEVIMLLFKKTLEGVDEIF